MFPSLAVREAYVAEANFASWKQGNVFESSQKHFCFTDAKRMFPSLATQGNMSGNNVSATMFPSLARPLRKKSSHSKTVRITVYDITD